ncbi:MAG: DUF1501 domain-containing protein [Gemmataceae bacterium]
MLHLDARQGTKLCDGWTRREILRIGALGLGSLTLPDLLRLELAAACKHAGGAKPAARAKSAILLFLSGGPSQLDMWDPKPNAPQEIRGTFKPIDTNVPGIRISEQLPRTARVADKCAILRSVCHSTPNHPEASYWMMVGSPIQRAAPQSVSLSREDRPHAGSALAKLLPTQAALPPFVMVPEAISPVGPERPGQHAGFLGPAYDPYRVNSDPNLPSYSYGALNPQPELSPTRLHGRHDLLSQLGEQAKSWENAAHTRSLDPNVVRAFDLVSSSRVQQAFDIGAEPERLRDRYGRHAFGQSVLLARRLVEAGVRLVQVNWVRHDNGKGAQGFDSHTNHLHLAKTELLPPTDAALSALIMDLTERGLLDETLIIVMGEFGRTPRFNPQGGRDHWPSCFSVLLAGGGIRGGQIYGASDKIAAFPTSNPVSPQDLIATLFYCLGVDPQTVVHDQQRRPFVLVEGNPVLGLL